MHPSADTGRVIAGRYRLQAPIGRGAMGVVWRAKDQLLDREVAIKEVQIADTLTDSERATAFQRTLREAKTAARLNHPAVVTVYDVAEDGGRPWIVMQLVSAQSLDQVIAASGPLSPRRAAGMARQLLSALSVAHAAGVMHRDVKPSNVLLDRNDRAVLTDFGIATFADDPKLTQTGMVMGSPGFTAPERIRGEDASPASDLWSLGATLYAAVEGHGPFEQRGGALTTMSAIINEDAPEAPEAGALGPVIAALLRREPADRPDASEAARMITDVLPMLADTGPPATQVSAAQTAPTAPQPVRGDTPRYGQSAGGWGQGGWGQGGWGQGAGAGYAPGASAGAAAPAEGPAGDFSSWYDPARRPGPAAPPGSGPAWSGSPAGQPGYDQAAWPGSASQQPPGSAPRSGSAPRPGSAPWSGAGYEPDRRPRSGLRWRATVAALVIIGAVAGVAAVVLLHHDRSGSPQGQTSQGSASGSTGGTLPPASLQIVDAVNKPNTGPLPSGFATVSQPPAADGTAGFSIAAPTSWKESTGGYQTYLKDPAIPNANILIDLTPHTYPGDMLKEAEYIEARSVPHFPGYQRVDLRALTIRGTAGAFWKFTWTNQRVPQEALDLLFVLRTSAGPQSYALYMTAPTASFNQLRSTFDEEVETFRPLTG